MSGLTLAPAGANVVMQLSRTAVGYGVVHSPVSSGALLVHPIKRTRTTLAYILVALYGTDAERVALAREVTSVHRRVRSAELAGVAYDALDPELQLWVAACMYRGALDALALVAVSSPTESTLDELYQHCARFATTLQVRPESWPPNRAAFEEYWATALRQIRVDEVTGPFLRDVVSLRFLPAVVRLWLGPLHRFVTAGFLPGEFRRELGLEWDDRRERRFRRMVGYVARVHRRLPRPLREFPLNWVWRDTRRRLRRGQSVL